MDVASILATLRAHQATLTAQGIAHVGLFGSVARGEAGPDSDIDILIEFAPDATPNIYSYVGMKEQIAALFPGKVDVIQQGG